MNGHSSYTSITIGALPSSLLLILLFLGGCHSYALDDAQWDLRDTFTSGDFEKSEALIRRFEEKDIYRSKDGVLFALEGAMVHRFSGNYDSSAVFFQQAENRMDDAYTKSISRGLVSFLVNDNKLVYNGEPYEDVYVNAFNSLNYLHLKDYEAALVETRRMAFKMEQLDIKIKGLSDAFAKLDTNKTANWKPGKSNIQNSAFSHYLATLLYAKDGKPDDARIEFEKLNIALQEQKSYRRRDTPEPASLARLQDATSYNFLLTGFTGQAPIKIQDDIRIFQGIENGFYLKFSLPRLELYNSEVYRVRAVINGKKQIPLQLIEEMDVVAAEVYKSKEPIIYARSLLRATTKAVGSKVATNLVDEDKEILRGFISLLGLIGQEATEKADLRGWQTLPGQAWMNVVQLPAGEHQIRMEYINGSGNIVFTETFDVQMGPDTELELLESIYSY